MCRDVTQRASTGCLSFHPKATEALRVKGGGNPGFREVAGTRTQGSELTLEGWDFHGVTDCHMVPRRGNIRSAEAEDAMFRIPLWVPAKGSFKGSLKGSFKGPIIRVL